MADVAFDRPITLLHGVGMPVVVRSIDDVRGFLLDWPPVRRTAAYWAARECCEHAGFRRVKPAAARESFENFARGLGILLADD